MNLDATRCYSFTSDIDWASEHCIQDLTDFLESVGIRPTLFATHKSAVIDALSESGKAQIGLHPNFLPGSTHGSDVQSVVDHVCSLYPQAKCFRSHALMDGTPITFEFIKRGFAYDSNLTTFFENGLHPIRHSTGLMRLPVFWEDDNHWLHAGTSWDLDAYYDKFLSEGMKIISVHPVHFSLNTPNDEFYRALPKPPNKMTPEEIVQYRFKGKGIRTFVIELLTRLSAQFKFDTLQEVYDRFVGHMKVEQSADTGRTIIVSGEDHDQYWNESEENKQKMLQRLYAKRNAVDPYATSRDYNLRELEIFAISQALNERPVKDGRLVDFGCGNGYTLISLAKKSAGWSAEGVDFSPELIDGANILRNADSGALKSDVTFHCGDAIKYVNALPDGSIDAAITERFLLNLPSKDAQRGFIREIVRALKPGGMLLMCEGSMVGFRGLNALRVSIGLDATLETGPENLSAIRFEDSEIEAYLDRIGLDLVRKDGFSSFFAMSRALHPALVRPQSPKFKSAINDLAREIQLEMPLTTGIGSNVLWIAVKR